MKPSKKCIDLIKRFEGYHYEMSDGSCRAYPDPGTGGDPWTIGWGTTRYRVVDKYKRSEVRRGDTLTEAQADAEFEAGLKYFADGVLVAMRNSGKPFTQSMYDAAVSFAYNTGLYNRNIERLRDGDFRVHPDATSICQRWRWALTSRLSETQRGRAGSLVR